MNNLCNGIFMFFSFPGKLLWPLWLLVFGDFLQMLEPKLYLSWKKEARFGKILAVCFKKNFIFLVVILVQR